jgi:flagellar basal-body rod protein FlgB
LLNTLGMKTLFDSVEKMEDAMTFHRDRHSVLAGNLANLDTPGYRPVDLERVAAASPETGVAIARTDDKHLTGESQPGQTVAFDDGGDNVGADGNAVNLEREMAKVAANKVRYATTGELVSRRLALLRYTATDGS